MRSLRIYQSKLHLQQTQKTMGEDVLYWVQWLLQKTLKIAEFLRGLKKWSYFQLFSIKLLSSSEQYASILTD